MYVYIYTVYMTCWQWILGKPCLILVGCPSDSVVPNPLRSPKLCFKYNHAIIIYNIQRFETTNQRNFGWTCSSSHLESANSLPLSDLKGPYRGPRALRAHFESCALTAKNLAFLQSWGKMSTKIERKHRIRRRKNKKHITTVVNHNHWGHPLEPGLCPVLHSLQLCKTSWWPSQSIRQRWSI